MFSDITQTDKPLANAVMYSVEYTGQINHKEMDKYITPCPFLMKRGESTIRIGSHACRVCPCNISTIDLYDTDENKTGVKVLCNNTIDKRSLI